MPAIYRKKSIEQDPARAAYDIKANPPELMNVREVAIYLGFSNAYIYQLIQTQKIPFIKISERAYRFKRDAIRTWVDERNAEEQAKEKEWERRIAENYGNA